MAVDAGSATTDAGSTLLDGGNTFADSGSAAVDSGNTVVDSGSAVTDAARPVVDSGSAMVDSGSAMVDSGSAVVDSGSVVADSGRTDAGAPVSDAGPSVCEPPATTPAYTPGIVWPSTATWNQNRCTAVTVQGFIDACLGASSTLATCNAWRAANATCSACLLTPRTAAAVGPFITSAAVTPANDNPPGLDPEWAQGLLSSCMNRFRAGCGPAYTTFVNCINAACDTTTSGNCVNATKAQVDACQEDAIGGGQGVCGNVALTALGSSGTCRGVFPADAGTALSGYDCFARGAARGEDTATQAGIDAYLKRVALYFCGP